MDENVDAEGNYCLIARKPLPDNASEFGLFPVGIFHRTNYTLPVSEFYFSLHFRPHNIRVGNILVIISIFITFCNIVARGKQFRIHLGAK